MGPVARNILAGTGTLVLHLGGLFWGSLVFAPHLDVDLEIEFEEVELLEPDLIQAEEPPPPEKPVVAPPTVEPSKPPEPAIEPEAKKEEPPKNTHDLGKRTTQVDRLGPVNSTFYMLLVPKKIRSLSFGDKARDIMSPLPDYQYLVAGGGLDPLEDFDHLVIASPDIRDWTQTFLAVDYKMSRAEMKTAIEKAVQASGEIIEWKEENGILRGNPRPPDEADEDLDPRWFVLMEDKVAVYVREEFLPHVLGEQTDESTPTAGNYVGNLAKLRKFAARQPTSGMQIVIKDIRRSVKRSRGFKFELPDRLEISVEATEEPEVYVKAEWPELVEAKAAELWWKDDAEELFSRDPLGIGRSIYKQVEETRADANIELWARFSTDQAAMILGFAADIAKKLAGVTPEEMAERRRRRLERIRERRRETGAGGAKPPEQGATEEKPGEAPVDTTPRTPNHAPPAEKVPPSDTGAPPTGQDRDNAASPPQGGSAGI